MWNKRKFSALTLLSVVIFNIVRLDSVSGQGMIALPDPVSEPSGEEKVVRRGDTSFGGKEENPEKAELHKKIAAAHLQGKTEESSDDKNNIVVKDKPVDLQDPQKHASDEWLLHFLLEQYSLTETSDANVEEQVDILQNLEHFAHKYENGRDLFQSTNALKKILLPALNSTYPEIRKAACGVFAVAAQNNAIVQKTALQNGVIRRLVHLLTFDLASVRSKALYGLASLLRNYPEAQKKFILDGGVAALVKAASLSETRKRSLVVITDLLTERKYCRQGREEEEATAGVKVSFDSGTAEENEDDCDKDRLLEKALTLNGWCDILVESVSNVGGFDIDDQMLITEAVEAGLDICTDRIAPYAAVFHRLLAKFEEDEDLSGTAAKQVLTILTTLDPLALAGKDEL